ncbi:hypothetical protein Kfla_3286 [Kribbella flavida DSM 17836]|uniref:Uncharacterized protein n=1 Tax=Kribbella flavida (strain DSM 17836 / JCM 10339 / NBRC 14399) TaxID=479435 RepID=D2Q4N3_KRIFD|nr:hypothetical protein [Kribbella flavida]ADB32347.1 hypothetical protein Kfla_3286 [Kribbella flavida DSM 17836]
MLTARTLAEAEVYLSVLAANAGGVTETPEVTRTEGPEGWTVSSAAGEVQVPYRTEDEARRLGVRFGLGNSLLLDAGDWVQLASVWAKRALDADFEYTGQPGQDRAAVELNWEFARDAMAEALKFLPEGADEVPDEGFWTELGLRTHAQDRELFTRAKLTEDYEFYRDTLSDFRALYGEQ